MKYYKLFFSLDEHALLIENACGVFIANSCALNTCNLVVDYPSS